MFHSIERWGAAVAVILLTAGCTATDEAPEPQAPAEGPPESISALGRIEPDVGVLDVGAPPGERILELRVDEGDDVQSGDVLAVFHSYPERTAALLSSQARLAEARQTLTRNRRLKPAAVDSRRSAVTKLEATLKLVESDLQRTHNLVDEGVVPARDREFQQTALDEVRAELANARALLKQEILERTEAVSDAEVRVRTAESVVEQAQALLDQSVLIAPSTGRILDIDSWQGESVDARAVLQLGAVERMMVVAEVYETDVQYVSPGQPATVTSPALPQGLTGKVQLVADIVQRNEVFDTDPRADRDARVLEVRILLDQPEIADDFVHLQVDVVIGTTEGSSAGADSGP